MRLYPDAPAFLIPPAFGLFGHCHGSTLVVLPDGGLLNAVIQTIPQHVYQRCFHFFQNAPVNFNLTALNYQLHLLTLVAGKFACKTWKNFEQ